VKPPSKAAQEQANRQAMEAAEKVQRFGVARASLPKGHTKIKFKDDEYFYQGGYWYWAGGGRYTSMIPPRGVSAPNLPAGSTSLTVGKTRYHYFNGTFYLPVSEHEYKVVDPPVGAAVAALPVEAESKVIGKKTYLVFDNAYYRPAHRGTAVVYQVVEAPKE